MNGDAQEEDAEVFVTTEDEYTNIEIGDVTERSERSEKSCPTALSPSSSADTLSDIRHDDASHRNAENLRIGVTEVSPSLHGLKWTVFVDLLYFLTLFTGLTGSIMSVSDAFLVGFLFCVQSYRCLVLTSVNNVNLQKLSSICSWACRNFPRKTAAPFLKKLHPSFHFSFA